VSCLGLLLVASAGGAAPRPLRELFDLVPADAVSVAVIQWSELRSSSIYRTCEERYAFDHDRMAFEDVARLTGIDPTTDVDAAMIAIRGAGDADRGVLGMLSGRFDAERIGALLTADKRLKVTIDERKDARVFRLAGEGEHPSSLAFARDGLLIFGDTDSVDRALGSSAGAAERLAPDSGLRQAFDSAPRSGQVWGAIELARILPGLHLFEDGGPPALAALKSLHWVSFNADFGADLALVVTGVCASPEEADLVRQALDGVVALGKLGAKDNPDILALFAETSIERAGDRITLRSLVSPDLLAKDHAAADGSRDR
jgi:hypothetical protein